MEAIQLHNREEEIVGTVLLKEGVEFSEVTDAWDKYLAEIEEEETEPEIYEFVSRGNWCLCEVLSIEFYQPI
jgi:hypothetical protein